MSPQHQCLIYEGAPSQQLASLASIMVEMLAANYRCLYLNSPPMVAGIRNYLSAAGLDVAQQVEKGALVLTSEQGHLVDGKFDVDGMIALLSFSLQQALSDGYDGLWASGDMTWEFGSHSNLAKLLEYKQRLDAFLKENPAIEGICQYHRDTLPPAAILTALDTHQVVHINGTLMHLNPFYRSMKA